MQAPSPKAAPPPPVHFIWVCICVYVRVLGRFSASDNKGTQGTSTSNFKKSMDCGHGHDGHAFYKKPPVSKTFCQKIDKTPSIFSRFLVYRISGLFFVRGIQTHHTERLQQVHVKFVLQQKSTKIQYLFFLGFVLSQFWAFLGKGCSKIS
jgi:hypothetical protein